MRFIRCRGDAFFSKMEALEGQRTVRVSVVMPVWNAAETLQSAMSSVLVQSLADWELMVVDDGSSDGSGELAERLAEQDQRVKVLRRERRGIVAALQAGCAVARGGYLARMDADDWMAPQRLEKQWRFLEERPEIGLVSCLVDYGGEAVGYAAHVEWLNELRSPEMMAQRRWVEAPVAHPSVMFRRELLERFGGYRDGDFPEDYELWLRWMEQGVKFGKVPEWLLRWNDPPTRLSRTDRRYSVEAFFAMKLGYLARWLQRRLGSGQELWLWGAGRVTRRRFGMLAEQGLRLAGFLDVDPKKSGQVLDGLPVRHFKELPARGKSFILAGVAARGARAQITAYLVERGWREGEDFLLVA